MKHPKKIALGVAVTVGLLWWTLSGVPFGEVLATIAEGDMLLLGTSIALTTFGFLVRAMRWEIFLRPVIQGTDLHTRFKAVAIHFMVNNVSLRVGEFARAWVMSRMVPVKATAAFGTVVVERFMDALVLLILLVVPTLLPGFPDAGVLSQGFGAVVFRAAVVAVLVVIVALLAMAVFPERFSALARAVLRFGPASWRQPLQGAIEAFLSSIAALRDPKLMALGLVWSFAFWALQAASFWLGMLAFGIDTGYLSAVFTSSVVAYGVALPSTPGFFGTFHFAANFALSEVYGVADVQSLAFAFGWHFGSFLPITAIGLFYAGRLGLSLGDVGAGAATVEAPGADGPPDDGRSGDGPLDEGRGDEAPEGSSAEARDRGVDPGR